MNSIVRSACTLLMMALVAPVAWGDPLGAGVHPRGYRNDTASMGSLDMTEALIEAPLTPMPEG